jgi:hypothetical protein
MLKMERKNKKMPIDCRMCPKCKLIFHESFWPRNKHQETKVIENTKKKFEHPVEGNIAGIL